MPQPRPRARLGYEVHIRPEPVTGEARAAASDFLAHVRHLARPACVIASGETTVHVRGAGTGGRNQEFAVAALAALSGAGPAALASIGTDGRDGPTDAAGAFVDDGMWPRMGAQAAARCDAALAANDAYPFLEEMGALVRTGLTGTNVGDLQVLLLPASGEAARIARGSWIATGAIGPRTMDVVASDERTVMSLKWAGIALFAVVVAFGAGWLSAASKQSVLEESERFASIRAYLADARADLLAGKVDLYQNNAGDAVAHFQAARNAIGPVQKTLREISQVERAGRFEIVIAQVHDAEAQAAMFDPHAQAAADEALKALQAVAGG